MEVVYDKKPFIVESLTQYNKIKLELQDLFDSRFNQEYHIVKTILKKEPKNVERIEHFSFEKFDNLFVGMMSHKVVTMIKVTDISVYKGLESDVIYVENGGTDSQVLGLITMFCGKSKVKGHSKILEVVKEFATKNEYNGLILHCVDDLIGYYKNLGFVFQREIRFGNYIGLNLMKLDLK